MMTKFLLLIFLWALAGCGADGAPMAKESTTKSGISVSGDAQMGVVVQNP